MTTEILRSPTHQAMLKFPAAWLAALAAVWISGVIALAYNGIFDLPSDQPALPTLLALAIPVFVFAGTMMASARLRAMVMAADPVLLTEFQAWRILGGLFLALYAFGELPGFFAWPAGLGDVAVGVAAPFVAWRLRRDPSFLKQSRYSVFHYLGLLDFVIAVSAGITARNNIPGLSEGITTTAMGQLPLVLIPTVVVPIFIVLHIIALMQVRSKRS